MEDDTALLTWECDTCQHLFSTKGNLKQHQKEQHVNRKAFHCDFCPKTFNCASALKIHTRRHTGDKPFKCLKCQTSPKAFTTRGSLDYHMLRHHTMAFRCDICNKHYPSSAKMEKHLCISPLVHAQLVQASIASVGPSSSISSEHASAQPLALLTSDIVT